ncbi:hypothetical protein COP2_035523 [Malus domestica]
MSSCSTANDKAIAVDAVIFGCTVFDYLGLLCAFRIICGGAKIDDNFQRVYGCHFVLLNHIVMLLGFSFSIEEDGGRSPYNPPSM